MGFWDTIGEKSKAVGKFASEHTMKAIERSSEYSKEMPSKNNKELAEIAINDAYSTPLKALAAHRELKNRGIEGNENIINLLK